jgi:hypothetical protein
MLTISIADLQQAAEIACAESSDIHRLPFEVEPAQLMAAMVSTTATCRAAGKWGDEDSILSQVSGSQVGGSQVGSKSDTALFSLPHSKLSMDEVSA